MTFKDIAITAALFIAVGAGTFAVMIDRDQAHGCESNQPIQGGTIKRLLTRSAPVPGGSGTGA